MSNIDKLWEIKGSSIHGEGVHLTKDVFEGTKIDTAINFSMGLFPNITLFASKINHSFDPSATLLFDEIRNVYEVYSRFDLPAGSEITLDYRETPFYIQGPEPHYV